MLSGVHQTQADIGLKNHRISAIGKGGNPDVMDGITPGMIVGVNTEVIAGEKLIVTYGAFDAHGKFAPLTWSGMSLVGLRSVTRSSSSNCGTDSLRSAISLVCHGEAIRSALHLSSNL